MHACKCELLYKNITQKVKVRIAAAPCNFIKKGGIVVWLADPREVGCPNY